TSVEAQACGKPVIGLGRGGVGETIIAGQTGEIYDNYNKDSLISAVKKFIKKKYLVSDCQSNASRFAKKNFQKKIKKTVEDYWKEFSTSSNNNRTYAV
ncbi:glycosyltransferase, partial [Candidatus Gottesmanbacteria bacterium]|nr:glycosyltransferase [Candidatus Gottesmanbacteria bacterium]